MLVPGLTTQKSDERLNITENVSNYRRGPHSVILWTLNYARLTLISITRERATFTWKLWKVEHHREYIRLQTRSSLTMSDHTKKCTIYHAWLKLSDTDAPQYSTGALFKLRAELVHVRKLLIESKKELSLLKLHSNSALQVYIVKTYLKCSETMWKRTWSSPKNLWKLTSSAPRRCENLKSSENLSKLKWSTSTEF